MTIANDNTYTLIRTIQAGQPLNGVTPADCGKWGDIMGEVVRAYKQAGTEAAMRVLATEPGLVRMTNEEQFTTSPSDPWQNFDLLPDLPAYARLTQAQERQAIESNLYLNAYTEYARAIVPNLPAYFHESAALWLGAVAIARRLNLKMPFADIYPNLYLLWVAPTTIYTKSTVLNIPRRILEQVMPHLRLPSEFSPEALTDSLAGKQPTNQADLINDPQYQTRWQLTAKFAARRGIILDEASSLFVGLKRDHNIGLAELLMKAFDCSDHDRQTKAGGLVLLKKPYVSFLGATTPVMLKEARNTQLFQSGLWPRFGFLLPRSRPTRWLTVANAPTEPPLLTAQLDRLANHYLPMPESTFEFPEPRNVTLDTEIFERFTGYHRALVEGILMSSNPPPVELHGPYGRLPTAALKIAIVLASLDWDGISNAPTIYPAHWFRAQLITEQWRQNIHLLYREFNGAAELDALEQGILGAVLHYIAKEGECSRRDVHRHLSKKPEEVHPVIDSMIEAGLLKESKPEGRRKLILEPGDGLPPAFVSKR